MGLANRLRMRRLKAKARKDENGAMASFRDLVESLEKGRGASQEEAIRLVYSAIAGASDRFLRLLFDALSQDLGKLDLYTMVRNVQASVPGVLLLMPFFLTLRHLSQNRVLVDRLASLLGVEKARGGRKILWFTDRLKDLNGVSVTLQEIGSLAHQRGLDLKIVTSIEPDALSDMPPNVLNLPFIHQFNLPYYESYNLKIPSVLASLKEIYRFEPDTIHISTPGPLGLLGLLTAKLMNIRSVGFYHTDFAMQAQEIVEDDAVAGFSSRIPVGSIPPWMRSGCRRSIHHDAPGQGIRSGQDETVYEGDRFCPLQAPGCPRDLLSCGGRSTGEAISRFSTWGGSPVTKG